MKGFGSWVGGRRTELSWSVHFSSYIMPISPSMSSYNSHMAPPLDACLPFGIWNELAAAGRTRTCVKLLFLVFLIDSILPPFANGHCCRASVKMEEVAPAGMKGGGQQLAVVCLGCWLVAAVAEMAAAKVASTMAEAVAALPPLRVDRAVDSHCDRTRTFTPWPVL